MLRLAATRVAPACATAAAGAWAAVTTSNDDWDEYFPPTPKAVVRERVVILGSGWAGLNTLRKCAGPGKDVVVVSPRPHFLYTPLLASSSVGTVGVRSVCEPLRELVATASAKAVGGSATFVRADAKAVDIAEKKVRCSTGSDTLEISYDKLIVAVGAQPNTFGIPGVQENALFLKEAEDAAKLHARVLSNLERAAALLSCGGSETEVDALCRVAVVGGGPTGVELCAELADFRADVRKRYGSKVAERFRVDLLEATPRILGPFDETLAEVARAHLEAQGVRVRACTAVTAVSARSVTSAPSLPRGASAEEKAAALARATTEDVGALVWAAGVGARPLVKKLAASLGQTDLRGLEVDEALRVKGAGGVYAIGDAALSGHAPTAQVAAQQGKHIGRCIRDGEDRSFTYAHAGSLCCLGTGNAIAQLAAPPYSVSYHAWRALHGAAGSGKLDKDQRSVTGAPAFALWRSLYFTQLLSAKTRSSVATDWVSTQLSGRAVFEPTLRRTLTEE